MYCANCGLKLPDWAHFCERCGSRVGETPDDPLDQVEIDGTFAEPLWDDADEASDDPSDDEQPAETSARTERMPMPPDEGADGASVDAGADDETVDDGELADEVGPEADEPVESEQPAEDEPADEVDPNDGNDGPAEPQDDERADEGERDTSGETRLMEEPFAYDDEDGEPAEEAASEDDGEAEDVPSAENDAEDEADQRSQDAGDSEAPREEQIPGQVPMPGLIGAGEDDGWDGEVPARYVSDPWRDNARPSDRMRRSTWRTTLTALLAVVSALALGLFVASLLLGRGIGTGGSQEQEKPAKVKYVSAGKAQEVLTTLNGWWKTGRTFDGRYWHFTGGIMEIYAADGKLARQKLVDPKSIEHMSTGPGGIEGAGYYLRDIAFFLLEDDPDTLHALSGDGDANEDANLLRTEAPSWVSEEAGGGEAPELSEGDSSEYLLPESATRIYSVSELEQLSDHDLFVARNEIYARHGYVFEGGELSEYFSSKSWYQPSDVFNEGEITEIERQNVSTILQIEQSRGSQYV